MHALKHHVRCLHPTPNLRGVPTRSTACRAPLAPLTAARPTLPRCRCYCTDDETADFFAELLGPRGGVAAIIANERGAEQGICPKLEKRGVVVLKLLDQTAAGKDDRQLVFLPPGSPTAFDGVPRPDGAPKVFPNQPYEERKTNWVTPQTPHLTPHIPLHRYEERKTATVDEAEEREALAKARAGRCGRPPLEKSLAEERAEGSDDVRKVAA